MSNINTVVLSGRATRDPELRSTQSGTSVGNLGIAVERYRGAEQEAEVSFFDITVWGNFAELVAAKLRKGDKITVEGRLQQSKWETESGEKRSKVEVVANQIEGEFLYRKADGSDTPDRSEGESSAAPAAVPAATDDDIPF
jgi:single-strand DNA-binding protein